MALPTYGNLKSLDYAFAGGPFCNVGVADSVDLKGLDFVFHAEPFAGSTGSSGPSEPVIVETVAAMVRITGAVAAIVSPIIPVTPAVIAAVAAIGQVCQLIHIAPPAGTILVTGSVSGFLAFLSAPPGLIFATGTVSDIQVQGIVNAGPGRIALGAAIGGLLFSVQPPTAQVQAVARVEQILRIAPPVIADPGVIVGAGRVQGIAIVVHAEAQIFAEPSIAGFLFAVSGAADIYLTGIAEIEIWQALSPVITYRCVLTGTADGLPDVVIPISSFQIRKRAL